MLLPLLGLVALLLTGFGPPRLVDRLPEPTQRLLPAQLAQMQTARTPPGLSARAYLLYDVDADAVLLTHNTAVALPPASLTKLMTALLILESGALTETVTVRGADLIGNASMGLVAGEERTVEELLWGLLIPSGNDAAMALARHHAGSVDSFVQQMNTRARALGLHQTQFANPHGLDAENHVSSAADLLILTRLLWDKPLFRTIVRTAETVIGDHPLRSTNEFLGLEETVNGVKTGTSDAAGQCLITGLELAGHQVFVVVLGSTDRYSDTRTIVEWYQANYLWVTGDPRELAALNRVYGPEGQLWYLRVVGAAPTVQLTPWARTRLRLYRRLQLPLVGQPWTTGLEVGVLEWRLDDTLIGHQPLVLW
jgi:D-alanyl-D-alanine carboxypeptidase